MTSEPRIGRARTVLGMAPMKFLAGPIAFALLVSSAWGQKATLHEAARQGDVVMIEALLAAGTDVDAYAYAEDDTLDRSTPLAMAARYGQVAAIEALLAAGADTREGTISDTERHYWAPLHWAVYEGHVVAVKTLLAAEANAVNAVSYAGYAPLCYAAENGSEEIIGMLLGAGASTGGPCGDGEPLHSAIWSGHVAAVELLLAAGADVDATRYGISPLHMATGDVALVDLLLSAGAHVDAKDTDGSAYGRTPLHFAALDSVEAVEMLLARGADANAEDTEGSTPLHLAADEGQVAAIETLLAAGADPNVPDADGRSPLDRAAAAGHTRAVEKLRRASRR